MTILITTRCIKLCSVGIEKNATIELNETQIQTISFNCCRTSSPLKNNFKSFKTTSLKYLDLWWNNIYYNDPSLVNKSSIIYSIIFLFNQPRYCLLFAHQRTLYNCSRNQTDCISIADVACAQNACLVAHVISHGCRKYTSHDIFFSRLDDYYPTNI